MSQLADVNVLSTVGMFIYLLLFQTQVVLSCLDVEGHGLDTSWFCC